MIVEQFTIENNERLEEFQYFISKNLNSSSLRTPIVQDKNGVFHVSLRCDIDDTIILEELFQKWNLEDSSNGQEEERSTMIGSFMGLFNFSKS